MEIFYAACDFFFFKEISFIQQESIKLIKRDIKDIYNVTNDLYIFYIFLFVKESWQKCIYKIIQNY